MIFKIKLQRDDESFAFDVVEKIFNGDAFILQAFNPATCNEIVNDCFNNIRKRRSFHKY